MFFMFYDLFKKIRRVEVNDFTNFDRIKIALYYKQLLYTAMADIKIYSVSPSSVQLGKALVGYYLSRLN